jgi:hypothetical protein
MLAMTDPEILDELLRLIDNAINGERCDARFALVVWCNCLDAPFFVGSNHGRDVPGLSDMLKQASEQVLRDMVEGHA